jgi:triosephosphate isomerase
MGTRGVLLAGNWKMNHGPKATAEFLNQLNVRAKSNAQMRLYVPYVSLTTALALAKKTSSNKFSPSDPDFSLEIGAQNIHFEKSGAFTGEISGPMLSELGIQQVLVGHSERRQYFNETDETVLKRTQSALEQGFEVLVCIGETLAERNGGQTETVLATQLKGLLADKACLAAFGKKLHIAYEPVWAIGTGVVASPAQAQAAHAFIRAKLSEKSSIHVEIAQNTKILYGGSVTPVNFKELLTCPDIDGGLVGGASVKVDSWTALWNLI